MTQSRFRQIFVAALVILTVGSVAHAQRPSADDLAAANRPTEERQRDAGSKPIELYTFFGVEGG